MIGRIMREKAVNASRFHMQEPTIGVYPAETQLKLLTAKAPLPQARKVFWESSSSRIPVAGDSSISCLLKAHIIN